MTDDKLRAALERIAWYPCQAGSWAGEIDPPRDRCLDPNYIEGDPDERCHPCDAAAALAASATDEGARCNCGVPGPHRLTCPVSIEAGKRIAALNQRADDIRIGYAAASATDEGPQPFIVRQFEGSPWVPLHEAARLHDAVQEAGVTIAGLRNSLAARPAVPALDVEPDILDDDVLADALTRFGKRLAEEGFGWEAIITREGPRGEETVAHLTTANPVASWDEGECGFNEPHEPHEYVVARDGKPVDLPCPGLPARPAVPALDVGLRAAGVRGDGIDTTDPTQSVRTVPGRSGWNPDDR